MTPGHRPSAPCILAEYSRLMKINRPRPSERAAAFLHGRIASDQYPLGSRLPPIAALAREAGVSLVTMWKAAGRLQAQGVLHSVRHTGTVVTGALTAPEPHPDAADARAQPAWEKLALRLESDMISGAFDRGRLLPSIKQLRVRYGANFRTMRKALDSLVAGKAIVACGRAYRPASQVARAKSGDILVFFYNERRELSLQHLDAGLLRIIETRCNQSGLRPVFIRYFRENGSISYVNHTTGMAWHGRAGAALGCLWVLLFDHEMAEECCRRLLSLACPVAVLDDTAKKWFPPYFRNNRNTQFITGVPFGKAAEVMARRLIELGHRHIAYISGNFAREWSQRNLDGLLRIYGRAGARCSVTPFAIDYPGAGIRTSDSPGFAPIAINRLVSSAKHFGDLPPAALREHLEQTAAAALDHSFYLWKLAHDMEPLFRKAIDIKKITAWVGGDDEEGVAAHSFLKRAGIPVPHRVSVVGFNNSLVALRNNLTSYGDNYEAMIHAMIDYVIRPGSARNKVLEIDGMLVERATTTGPAQH